MNSALQTPKPSDKEAAKPADMDAALWEAATPAQQQLLKRISRQRSRLQARSAARTQAQSLRDVKSSGGDRVQADLPLAERAVTFVRLHPIATAVAGAALLAIGPRKLMRWGSIALPWIMKLQQGRMRS